MEENKNEPLISSITTSTAPANLTPIAGENSSPPPPVPNKHLFKKIIKVLAIILVICVVAVAGAIAYGVHSFTSSCRKKATAITATDNRLKNKLQAIQINGNAPTSVTTNANTDCIDGSDTMNVQAIYTFASPNVTAADAAVTKVLSNTTAKKPFTPNTTGGNYVLSELDTTISAADGTNYSVAYNLQTPITCQTNGQTVGCNLHTAIDSYNLMNQPIKSIALGLSGTAQY